MKATRDCYHYDYNNRHINQEEEQYRRALLDRCNAADARTEHNLNAPRPPARPPPRPLTTTGGLEADNRSNVSFTVAAPPPHQHEPSLRNSDAHDYQPRLRVDASPPSAPYQPAGTTPPPRGRRAKRAHLLFRSNTAVVPALAKRPRLAHTIKGPLAGRCQIRPPQPPTTLPR
jgi:hypothetical protein